MTTLQFADTHNLVAFLTKSAKSEGFKQIVDFLNAKMVNGEVQLQALVDGKKIVVSEASVRRDLQLKDVDGVDCLPNAIIFEQLYTRSAKTTAWNEFSSTMDSAIISEMVAVTEEPVCNLRNYGFFVQITTMLCISYLSALTGEHKECSSIGDYQFKERESREASLGDQEDASKPWRKINDIDADAKITFDMAEKEVSTADLVTTAGEVVTTANVEVSDASLRNIMDEIDIEDLTIKQYLRLTQESQTPKKINDMTIAEYLEYEKKKIRLFMKRKFETSTTSDEVSSIASNEVERADDNTPNIAPCRLPKELSPGSFLLPFNINNHNLYPTTTLDAKDNIMPQRVYEHLGLDKLSDTSTLENMTRTNEPLETINILVKFRELEFPCNFVIEMAEEVIILGRPFLESTRAQIDVFNEEILFQIGSEKFKFDKNSHQCIEKIYMVDIGQEEETFNPLEIGIDLFSYESPACL
ncbi:xylulose kinase-1 [Tanacetum coccineum]